ncbi:MAG: murein biosynthesis integral membrane protein MurJ [Clostridiales bacterium]|nr:murein biosynthesis integral membrane protein MurJ [Clostridiales bacterium]
MSNPPAKQLKSQDSSSKKTKSIAFSTIIMIIGLFLSKGSGFLRDILVSHSFNETYRDAFTGAFLIPDFFFALLVGGSIQSAITPTLSRAIENKTERKTWKGVSIFISWMTIVVLVFVVFGEIFSNPLYKIFNQNDSEEVVHLAGNMARTLYPQIFFMMLAALCIGILNAYKKFGSTAFGPTIYNICVLLSIGLLGGSTEDALIRTGLGIMASALIYFVFQLFMGKKEISHFKPSLDTSNQEFRSLFKLAVPILISASVVQLNMLILNSFATRFQGGPLFALRNAGTLWQLPYGIFAVGIGNVMLPSLASLFAAKEYRKASDLLSQSIKNALFLTIPCAGIFLILRSDLVRAAFKWSDGYTEENVKLAALFLTGYCLSIVTQSIIFIINQAFYAIGKTRFPLFAGIVSMIVNTVLCVVLLKVYYNPLSLTIAYSASCVVRLILLAVVYSKNKALAPRKIRVFIVKSVICLIAMIGVLFLIDLIVPLNPGRKLFQLAWLGARCVVGFVVYFVVAFLLKMEELKVAYEKYVLRFFRKKKKA